MVKKCSGGSPIPWDKRVFRSIQQGVLDGAEKQRFADLTIARHAKWLSTYSLRCAFSCAWHRVDLERTLDRLSQIQR